MTTVTDLSVLEICAGAGGESLGLEQAGFGHSLAVEIDPDACETLRLNRPGWDVHEGDVREVSGTDYRGIDLLAGGVPCPPFSIAGKQLGGEDERDLFPEALRLVREAKPSAVLLENVRGLSTAKFSVYRQSILDELDTLGYHCDWQVIHASEHGVPQLRPRFILVAVLKKYRPRLGWPEPVGTPPTVGQALLPLMKRDGWEGACAWAKKANGVGPTLVGGSRKHGGPDLGPTRARAAWLALGVDGKGLADAGPTAETPYDHIPRLTVEMAARIQGFPTDWRFSGRKTAAYRQVGNAFPPPVAKAIGKAIRTALGASAMPVAGESSTRLLKAV
jgi:DNA (cytosine-5)-methyltransferase 1